MSEADQFLEAATQPDNWFERSKVLRQSADVLWDTFVVSWFDSPNAGHAGHQESLKKAVDFLMVAQMLYGLALETAMKGTLLQTQPSAIQLQMTSDGTGAIQSVYIKQFGVSLDDGHNLEKLAELIGLIQKDDNRLEREILRHLSECILWKIKYPVPTNSRAVKPMPDDVPTVIFGHHMRDWIEPWLDKLLGTPPKDPGEHVLNLLTKLQEKDHP